MKRHLKDTEFLGKKGYKVKVKNNDINGALRVLKHRLNQEGWSADIKRKEYYISPGQQRRLDHKQNLSRVRKVAAIKKQYEE